MQSTTARSSTDAAEQFLPARQVWERYGVTQMSLWRWLRDPELKFPQPIRIGRFRYWRLSDLIEWERSRVGTATTAEGATLFHYSSAEGQASILESHEMWASHGWKDARFGGGQYFTDIAPESIGGRTLVDTPEGMLSLGQLSRRLYEIPWNTAKLTHFIEVDVAGLEPIEVAPNIWLVESDSVLDIDGRVVRIGETLH